MRFIQISAFAALVTVAITGALAVPLSARVPSVYTRADHSSFAFGGAVETLNGVGKREDADPSGQAGAKTEYRKVTAQRARRERTKSAANMVPQNQEQEEIAQRAQDEMQRRRAQDRGFNRKAGKKAQGAAPAAGAAAAAKLHRHRPSSLPSNKTPRIATTFAAHGGRSEKYHTRLV
ncbi:hypothetical protein EIP91_008302 [Steccherinum ochraceum]|uniref:Uncharacterized protein n=1 Tax=Steccherinum ochraceum TaxID=92696 RepID=A0A4R0R8P6_9APHY|nr:hypothetical protein EIP91_008302 [Steccherinum ochraceum]